ncbi:hypothetical protein PsorP6_010244 [Peronosclerospora sorghi]|uniref:Uncharacterized protein n=1 Tax=Peronosclerospora sorghi TaxID=230839 RepID=A0ACC0VWN2_9STRA|nr:hypothetical protein PsorP6_010244 [Peronosclerospora sorghi]
MSNWFAPMLEGVEKDGGTYLLVSLAIDATKVPPKYQLNLPYKVFVGRTFPHYMIALSGIEDTDGIERQNPFLDIASEVKCAVMTVQNASPRYSPMKLIVARPQSTNECTPEFNTLLESAVKSNPRVRPLSMVFDGVSSEADYVRDMLVDFLNGRGDTVSVVDPNHVAKAVRSQLILGSNIVLAGDYLVDPGLFLLPMLSDVHKNRLTTSEPAEPMFGLLRQWSREFSVSDLLTLSRKLDEILRCSFESDIRSTREGLKGYQASFPGFVASVQAMLHSRDNQKDSVTAGGSSVADDAIPSEADDGIKVDRSGVESVAEQIETALFQLLNLTSRQMKNLLNRAGFEAMSPNSPFIRNFSTLKDLSKEFVKYMPRTYKYPNEAEDEVAAPTSDDVCESGDEEKSYPSSRDSIRQVVDLAQGILTGSPKEDEAVVFPSCNLVLLKALRKPLFLTFAAEHLRVCWMSVVKSGAPQLSLLKPLKRWEDRKCLPEVVRLWLYRKKRFFRVDGIIRAISALMGTTAAATRSLPPSLG